MSHADLEVCQDLPKVRVLRLSPEIKQIQTPEPSEAKPSHGNDVLGLVVRKYEDEEVDEYEEECRTPTSEQHRIPEVLTCPPAPRKPAKARAPGCKRKLSELDFFEDSNRDEVEGFFRSSFVVVAVKAKKRINRCPCK